MTETADTHSATTQPSDGASAKRSRGQQRARPGKSLPTDRMKFEAQLRCLRVYGKLSGQDKKAVTAERASTALNKEISHYTVGLSNGFFVDAGWLEKRGRGEYAAADPLITYVRRLGVDNGDVDRAVESLREAAQGSWFWRTIQSQLEFGGASEENELLYVLMDEAEASADHIPQLKNLLEWAEYIRLVRRANGHVYLVQDVSEPTAADETSTAAPVAVHPDELEVDRPADPTLPEPTVETPQSTPRPVAPVPQTNQAPALMSFDFSCRVTADDLAKLNGEQIQAVFAAVGTLMSVKGRLDG